jgi:hypothetical protein
MVLWIVPVAARSSMVLIALLPGFRNLHLFLGVPTVAKPHRNLKKANHGARPANSKARKMKRKHIRT